MIGKAHMRMLRLGFATLAVGAAAALPAQSVPAAADVEQRTIQRAQAIRADLGAKYRSLPAGRLAVTEATSTAVVESFTLLSADFLETRVVAAGNGIYFAICPVRATCPSLAHRVARPATDLLPRRLALELVLRTFLETSADLVTVSLPTSRFTLLIVGRDELAREVDLPGLSSALSGDPSYALPARLAEVVDRVTRPRVFLFAGLEPTPRGRETWVGVPRWRN
jgi:hypothetical protein